MGISTIYKIQTAIFRNRFRKFSEIIKAVSFLAALYFLINYVFTISVLKDFFEANYNKNDTEIFQTLNILLFAIFILNIVSSFFLGTGKTLTRRLRFFPISTDKIVLYEITAKIADISNLPFVALYFAVFFVVGPAFTVLSFVEFLIVFVLFVFFVSNTVFLIQTAILLLLEKTESRKKIIFSAIVLFAVFSILIKTPDIKRFVLAGLNASVGFMPTSKFLSFQYLQSGNFVEFIITLLYFIILNLVLLKVNIFLSKKGLKGNFRNVKKNKTRENRTSPYILLKNLRFDALTVKELLYHFRSLRMAVLFLLLVVGYSYIFYYLINSNNKAPFVLILQIGLLYQTVYILVFSGNLFKFDGKNIKMYFVFPKSYREIIDSKVVFTYIFTILHYFFLLAVFGLYRYDLSHYLALTAFMLASFISMHYIAVLLAFYFPKNTAYNELNGFNFSPVLLMFIAPILLADLLALKFIVQIRGSLIGLVILLAFLFLLLIVFEKKLKNVLARQLYKKRNDIIKEVS